MLNFGKTPEEATDQEMMKACALVLRDSDSRVYVEFRDPRKISREQQKKAYALIGEIARWWGYMPQEAAKELTKVMFLTGGAPVMLADTFSLADCTTTAIRTLGNAGQRLLVLFFQLRILFRGIISCRLFRRFLLLT